MASRSRPGRPPHADVLTPAEWRTVHAVKHGLTSRQIAERRGISIDAVKYHIANALAKLGLANRKQLRHWHRVPRDSALQENVVNAQVKLGSIAQIARSVQDIKQAEEWYKNLLGLPHLYTFGKLAFFDCGGTRLMLSQESAAVPRVDSLSPCGRHRGGLRAVQIPRRRIHQCAAPDPQTCRRNGGMAVHVQRSRGPPARTHGTRKEHLRRRLARP
jgi:DNA-binding CsgD family transcriptional regulator